jgi:putative transposase
VYEFVKAHHKQYGVRAMCRILRAAPSGYYKWLLQPTSKRAQEDARLLRLIRASFQTSQGVLRRPALVSGLA